ncbi:N-acetylmuramoyl-L-alanine amidase family protein [Pectinatus sottacetonis]|uniref:N-acetylmuramoyl-L-alanine amidase family protein n=1 Tax=Pectinatus sottacetonis TaxID=1002795 RepID=UPI0018C62BA6|nr:N-acetylmuramoyl-L-alanine amidase [Pectinatus sottacetonis]
MNIFLNPGHSPNGNPDPGACNLSLNLRECDIALSVGNKVRTLLLQNNYNVRLLQSNNLCGESPSQPNVTYTANSWSADIFVSIHCNSFNSKARGAETLIYPDSIKGLSLANNIQSNLITAIQSVDTTFPNRGVKPRGDLAVLRYTNMPAVLIELGFIDQKNDAAILTNFQDTLAQAISSGVISYIN